ncbi:MAG: YeeE/YedE thiosulfate transporter family protein, partial [Vicinamibacterales bacterium]
VSLTIVAVVWIGATIVERCEHGRVMSIWALDSGTPRWLSGPWPLLWGAVGLVAVNVATLVLAGRPWGVTSAFALWGAKTAVAMGMDVMTWPYWQAPARAVSLTAPVATDVTSVMDLGIILGALVAAGLAGRFAPVWRIPAGSAIASVLGGLLLGYGARAAYGCNIGAYFSGVASTSLHGWLWFVCAFVGNVAGTRARRWFGLPA